MHTHCEICLALPLLLLLLLSKPTWGVAHTGKQRSVPAPAALSCFSYTSLSQLMLVSIAPSLFVSAAVKPTLLLLCCRLCCWGRLGERCKHTEI